MRQTSVLLAAILVFLGLSACTNKSAVAPSEKRQATVVLQDGSTVTGAVVASSESEITLAGGDNITRTIPMTQVKSVQYGGVVAQPQRLAEAPQEAVTAAKRPAPAPAPVRESVEQPRPPAPLARVYELPAGTELSVRNNEMIDSGKAAEGQGFSADVFKDLLNSSGAVVIPRGSQAQLVILSASKGGRFQGSSDLVLSLTSVTVRGRRYQLDAADVEQRGKQGVGANKRTATYTGGGAAVGAIIGAIAGGGRGAAIGAGAGAGAGALTQVLTRGGAIRVPAESVLVFRLDTPLRVAAE